MRIMRITRMTLLTMLMLNEDIEYAFNSSRYKEYFHKKVKEYRRNAGSKDVKKLFEDLLGALELNKAE